MTRGGQGGSKSSTSSQVTKPHFDKGRSALVSYRQRSPVILDDIVDTAAPYQRKTRVRLGISIGGTGGALVRHTSILTGTLTQVADA